MLAVGMLSGCAGCRLYPMAPVDELVRARTLHPEQLQLCVSCRLE